MLIVHTFNGKTRFKSSSERKYWNGTIAHRDSRLLSNWIGWCINGIFSCVICSMPSSYEYFDLDENFIWKMHNASYYARALHIDVNISHSLALVLVMHVMRSKSKRSLFIFLFSSFHNNWKSWIENNANTISRHTNVSLKFEIKKKFEHQTKPSHSHT